MPTAHLLHGIATKGHGSIKGLTPYCRRAGVQVDAVKYGFTWLVSTRRRNPKIASDLVGRLEEGDVIITFSNGASVGHRAALEFGRPLYMVHINPALRSDVVLPPNVLRTLVLYSPSDKAVVLARWLRKAVPYWCREMYWGQMGKTGYLGASPLVDQINMDVEAGQHLGHRGALNNRLGLVGENVLQWLKEHVE